MDSINERVQKLIDLKYRSRSEFAREISVSEQYISQLVNKNSGIGIKFITKIAGVFPNINLKWLILGEGEMFERTNLFDELMEYQKTDLPPTRENYERYKSILEMQLRLVNQILELMARAK